MTDTRLDPAGLEAAAKALHADIEESMGAADWTSASLSYKQSRLLDATTAIRAYLSTLHGQQSEAVAWRYRGHFKGKALPWQMTDQQWLADRQRDRDEEVEPLYTHPLPTEAVAPVAVKALEWHETPLSEGTRFEGVASVGSNYAVYALWHGQRGKLWWIEDASFADLDEAKAAAQSDFNARILSALIPAAKPAGVEEALKAENEQLRAERDALFKRINSPETEDWMAGVPLEAAHQIERHGSEHDAGKTAWDWFWLIGYLSQKAATSQAAGDLYKAKHHTISTAAALLNWHRHLTGETTAMHPGIDPVARGIEPAAAIATDGEAGS